jgi:homocysteine S-methyltransferase
MYLTDGGIETTLIFHRGLDLPAFAGIRPVEGRRGHERAARTL